MVKLTENEITQMQIKRIEKEIRDTPYHKATEHHIGRLRAKLSKLKEQEMESGKKSKGGGSGGYAVKHQGDATVVLVGPPSVGKSTLLNTLTNAKSKVAPYEFTTVSVIPGMMEYKNAKIQILDVPGLIKGAEEGKGRGREVLSVVRGCDLLIIMTDFENLDAFKSINKTLFDNGIRINTVRPNVIIDKKLSGGIILHSNIKQDIGKETIKDVASEMGIKNAEIALNEKLTIESLIDALSKNRVYIPTLYIVNKTDLLSETNDPARINDLNHWNKYNIVKISAERGEGMDVLREKIWEKLNFIRVYLVRPDEKPSYDNPVIIKVGQNLKDVAEKIGEEFAEDKEKAKIWGVGAKFPGQEVSLTTKVAEGMQVRFI